jgi:hypothetical protein
MEMLWWLVKVSEQKEVMESLTSLKIQVDHKGQVHSFADDNKTWIFTDPISVVDLVEKYNNLLEETGEGLTPLKIQVDHEGQVHSFANSSATWKFISPISLVDLVETYKEVLTNVVMELKSLKEPLTKSSSSRFFNRR